jgi:hypothetical protein
MKVSHYFSGFLAVLVVTSFFSQLAQAGFESFYEGSPDLVISRIEQDSSQIILAEVCNQGTSSTWYGPLKLSVSSTRGTKYQERNYANISFAGGECRAFKLQKLTWLASSTSRSYSLTLKVTHSGERSEIRTINNSLSLGSKKSTAVQSVTTGKTKNSQITEDLWGKSNDSFSSYPNNSSVIYPSSNYPNSMSNHSYQYNSNYPSYNYFSNSNNPNGDFSPSNPTWEMQKKNVIYVYSGPGNGYWYTYNSTGNNNYSYTPVPQYNGSSNYFDSSYPALTTLDGSYYTVSPQSSFGTYYNGTYPLNNNLYSSVNPPSTVPSGCSQWQFNASTGRYEWYCNGNTWGGYGQPDLYLKNLKQNGTKRELTATVCNQGDSMRANAQIALRVSNGVGSSSATSYGYTHLVNGGCTDIPVLLSGLTLFGYAANYLFYAEVDANNVVSETREDNNSSYWRMIIE